MITYRNAKKRRSVIKDVGRLIQAEDLLKQVLSRFESGKIRVDLNTFGLASDIKNFLNEESTENRHSTEQD